MLGGQLPTRPSEALAEHLWLSPFPEGLREPLDYAGRLADHGAAVACKVLRGNTAGLLGLHGHAPAPS